jgi:hypothetical protein
MHQAGLQYMHIYTLLTVQAQPEPTEADAGIIERIYLENFLCHSKLDVALGPNLNFIHGKNGSAFCVCMYVYIYIFDIYIYIG